LVPTTPLRRPCTLSPLQERVATIIDGLEEAEDFALAGGSSPQSQVSTERRVRIVTRRCRSSVRTKGSVGVMTPDDLGHSQSDKNDHCTRQHQRGQQNHAKEDQCRHQ
jgi:hypothetical protein